MRKLLISYSGHARSYKDVMDTHIDNLIEPLSRYFDIHVKGLFHKEIDIDTEESIDVDFMKRIFEKYNHTFDVVSNEEISTVHSADYSHIAVVEHARGRSALPGIASMFYLMQKSLDCQDQFDIRFRIRSDLKFLSKIDCKDLDTERDVVFPRFGHFSGGRNDQFFAITKNVSRFMPYDDYVLKQQRLHPENILRMCLSEHSQHYAKSFEFVIQRTNGETVCQRNYARLGD